jgi:hypothetical protein
MQSNREADMADNTGIDAINDDFLEDEALDRTEGGEARLRLRFCPCPWG